MAEIGIASHNSNHSMIHLDEERLQRMIIDQIRKFKPWASEFVNIMNKTNAMGTFNNPSKMITDRVLLALAGTVKQ